MYVDDVEQSAPGLKRLLGDDLIVLEDSTHFMRRYLATIPDHHPLKGQLSSNPLYAGEGSSQQHPEHCNLGAGEFAALLSGSIFNLHEPDKVAEIERLQRLGKTAEEIAALPAKYFNSRCRRTIPGKGVVGPRLTLMMEQFRHAGNVDGQALLTPATWKVHERQMRLVERDLLTGL